MEPSDDIWAVLEEWAPFEYWSEFSTSIGRWGVSRIWWIVEVGETKRGRRWIAVSHMGLTFSVCLQRRFVYDLDDLRRTMRALDAAAKAYDAAMEAE